MRRRSVVLMILVTVVLLIGLGVSMSRAQGPVPQGQMSIQTPLDTSFMYQGRLNDGGRPANGTYDFRFKLYDAQTGGHQIGSTVGRDDVEVRDGFFVVYLDFGSGAFDGEARWLEVAVRPGDSTGSFTVLSPRQPIVAVPYALYSLAAPWNGLTGVPAGFADGVDNDTTYTAGTGLTLSGTQFSLQGSYRLPQGCSNGQVPKWNGSRWTCANDEAGGGGAYWSLTGNAGTDPNHNFLGTTDRVTFTIRVSNTQAFRIEPGDRSPNIIGGHSANYVYHRIWMSGPQDPEGSFIGGGGTADKPNIIRDGFSAIVGGIDNYIGTDEEVVTDLFAHIGGGQGNWVAGLYGTIGGGSENKIWDYYAEYGTVSGGLHNVVLDASHGSTIGGGMHNIVDNGGEGSTIGGGVSNAIRNLGFYDGAGTIAGGRGNTVRGNYGAICGGHGNTVTADYGTIAGGGRSDPNDADTGNRVTDKYGTIGGGGYNRAGSDDSNPSNAIYATVGGGYHNTASGAQATVGGGYWNTARGSRATVGGGYGNTASGYYATVPGGSFNTAQGSYSFAAGRRAKARHNGAFVWADSTNADFTSDRANQFKVRAYGGVHFVTRSSGLHPPGVMIEQKSNNGVGLWITQQSSDAGLVVTNKGSGDLIKAFSGSTGGNLRFRVTNAGHVYADGSFHPGGADLAEMLPAGEALEPGDVLVVGPDGKLHRSREAYSTAVVGVYSTQPGIVSDAGAGTAAEEKVPLAVVGVVPVKASAENGPIRPGDLLVSAATPGHAMKADPNPPVGTVIGKALQGLEEGTGTILMLVMMH